MSGAAISNEQWSFGGTAGAMLGSFVHWQQSSHRHEVTSQAEALEQRAQTLIDGVTPPPKAGRASPFRLTSLPSQGEALAGAKTLRAEAQSLRASVSGRSSAGALVGLARLAIIPPLLLNTAGMMVASARGDKAGVALHGAACAGNALLYLSTHVANPRLVAGFGVTGAVLSVAGPILQDARHLP